VTVALAESDAEIARCFEVMSELRPHLRAEDFVPRVRRQGDLAGFALAYVEEAGEVVAVAGFRVSECLAWGRFLYVDDLVSAARHRSRGHGGTLLRWLEARARAERCDELHLDSGVQRFGAHRFYLRERMDITSHHFAKKL
jgi:GNAT superfamily N-acetyltransferase